MALDKHQANPIAFQGLLGSFTTMLSSRGDTLVRHWHERFKKDPLASKVISELRERRDEIWQHTFQLLKRDSTEYRNSVDDEFAVESKAHCGELLRTIISIPTGRVEKSDADPFDFVRVHAEWRARHRVPLIASLHAYRLGHRTYSEISQQELSKHGKPKEVVRSLTLLSDFWIQLFDHIGAVLAEAHVAEDGLIIAQSTRSYAALMDDLLRGTPSGDVEGQRLCQLCGIRPGAPMAIVVARPRGREIGEIADSEVLLRSLVRLIEQVLPPNIFGRLVGIRNNEVIAIVCSHSETARGVVKALKRSGFAKGSPSGHPVNVGVSPDVTDITLLPQALDEARMALDFASEAKSLVYFPDIDLLDFLVRHVNAAAFRLMPCWAHDLAPGDQSQDWVRTIKAFADGGLNVKQTARRLGVHTNTVYFRLNRIQKFSGINPRTYSGLTTLLITSRLLELHANGDGKRIAMPGGPAE
jgi:hypothetical protein